MSILGVNEHHSLQILSYLRFARSQRTLSLRGIDKCFKDTRNSRFNDETYTRDELNDIINDLESLLNSEFTTELINFAHTSVLLLMQVFQQSEKWHLKLSADISELENRELLEKIKDFEDSEFSGAKRDLDVKLSRLEPINEKGGTALLYNKIKELESENESMKSRLKQLGDESFLLEQERNRLRVDLTNTKDELDGIKPADDSSAELTKLTSQVSNMRVEMEEVNMKNKETNQQIEQDLVSTKHELLRIQEMLEMAEKELEKKVHQTTPFKNMKQMLMQKNERIKSLRTRLSRYESDDDS